MKQILNFLDFYALYYGVIFLNLTNDCINICINFCNQDILFSMYEFFYSYSFLHVYIYQPEL